MAVVGARGSRAGAPKPAPSAAGGVVASPPAMRDSRPAQQLAAQRLKELGPLSRSEKVMAAASGLTLMLWVGGGVLGESEFLTPMLHCLILLQVRTRHLRLPVALHCQVGLCRFSAYLHISCLICYLHGWVNPMKQCSVGTVALSQA